eukprot:COSAG04_NODE_10309_length_787_cov_1.422965_1_plen_144_part_01
MKSFRYPVISYQQHHRLLLGLVEAQPQPGRVGRHTSPRYAESMAGGASQAPKRKSFPGEAMALLIMSPCMSTPRTIAAITVGKAAALPDAPLRASGASRFTPVSVHRDQLLCFPEPFTPAVQKLALSAQGMGELRVVCVCVCVC